MIKLPKTVPVSLSIISLRVAIDGLPIPAPAPINPDAATPAPITMFLGVSTSNIHSVYADTDYARFPAPKIAVPTATVSVTTPLDCPCTVRKTVLGIARLRSILFLLGWNRLIVAVCAIVQID